MKIPSTVGACVDKLYQLRAARLVAQHKVDDMKAQEARLSDHLINSFSKGDLEGAKGKVATVAIVHSTKAHVLDWTQFFEYVAREKSYELVQRRVNDAAYRERLEAGNQVPGLEPFDVLTLSVKKVSR